MESWVKRLSLRAGILIALLMLALLALWAGMERMVAVPCTNRLMRQVPSPDGSRKAVIFERDCGTEGRITTQVSVIDTTGSLPKVSGNLFAADGRFDSRRLQVAWVEAAGLTITYRGSGEVLKTNVSVGGVKAVYHLSAAGNQPAKP
jgi:hypothetical protein